MSTNKKRKTCWNEKYAIEFGFVEKDKDDDTKVFCKVCSTTFSIASGGRADIIAHAERKRHKSALNAATTSKKVQDFFKTFTSSNDDRLLAAKEATFAFHTARHNFSFRSNDCTSELIRDLFEPKFTLARTKTVAIIKNVIGPLINEEDKKLLDSANFISIMTDTSNHKSTKILPILARFFVPTKGVINKKIATIFLPNEKSSTICDHIVAVINEKSLRDKAVAFTADNTNLNFGGVARNGRENVWRKLQVSLSRLIIGNGCSAHITHNASNAGCEILDVDLEALIVKFYKHFSIYTVRTETFKQLCDELDTVYKPLQTHSSTRFLSFEPAVNRILELFEPLKQYLQNLDRCPPNILSFFKNPAGKFWLIFISNQAKSINESIKIMERSSTTSFEAANELMNLKCKLQNRQKFIFLPRDSQTELAKLSEEQQAQIKRKVYEFYSAVIEYIELWEKSFDGSEIFMWMLMRKYPEWNDILKSFEFAELRFGSIFANIVNHDILFDEYILMENFVLENCDKWNTMQDSPEDIWIEIFNHFREQGTRLVNMEKFTQYAFAIAGTSTENERIFSLINQIWSDQKNHFTNDTLDSILTIQYNLPMSCMEFFKFIKNNNSLLEKIHSKGKYN